VICQGRTLAPRLHCSRSSRTWWSNNPSRTWCEDFTCNGMHDSLSLSWKWPVPTLPWIGERHYMHGYRDDPISWNVIGDTFICLLLIDNARFMLCIWNWHPRKMQIDEHDDMIDNPGDDGRMGSCLATRGMRAKAHQDVEMCMLPKHLWCVQHHIVPSTKPTGCQDCTSDLW
jgi:hypothetical protein